MLMDDHDSEKPEEDELLAAVGSKTSTTDKTLFSLLKDLRKEIARKEKLPPFVIFQDPSLEDMAIQYPITMDELQADYRCWLQAKHRNTENLSLN